MSARTAADTGATELPPDEPAPAAIGLPAVRYRPYRPSLLGSLREAWHHRHLIRPMAASVVMRSFHQTLLGPGWIVLQVLMDTVGKAFIFGSVLNVPSTNNIPYYLFLMTGMMCWRVFQRSLTFTMRSFNRFKRMTTSLSFPLLLVPVAATAQGLIEWVIYATALLGTLVYFSISDHTLYLAVGPQLLLAPLALLWSLVFAWAIGFVTAPLFQRARDVRFIIRYALPFWLYVTPIIYPIDRLHGKMFLLAELNPMAAVVELFKYGLVDIGPVSLRWLLYAAAATAAIFAFGLWFLNRFGPALIEGDTQPIDDEDDEVLA